MTGGGRQRAFVGGNGLIYISMEKKSRIAIPPSSQSDLDSKTDSTSRRLQTIRSVDRLFSASRSLLLHHVLLVFISLTGFTNYSLINYQLSSSYALLSFNMCALFCSVYPGNAVGVFVHRISGSQHQAIQTKSEADQFSTFME